MRSVPVNARGMGALTCRCAVYCQIRRCVRLGSGLPDAISGRFCGTRGRALHRPFDIEVSSEPRCQPRHAWRALSCLFADGRPERRGIGVRAARRSEAGSEGRTAAIGQAEFRAAWRRSRERGRASTGEWAMNAGGSGRQFVAVSTASLGQGSFAMRGMLLNGFLEESEIQDLHFARLLVGNKQPRVPNSVAPTISARWHFALTRQPTGAFFLHWRRVAVFSASRELRRVTRGRDAGGAGATGQCRTTTTLAFVKGR